jgi:hypothetical protein
MFIHPAYARTADPKPRQAPRFPAQLVSWWAHRFQRSTVIQTRGVWHSNNGRRLA